MEPCPSPGARPVRPSKKNVTGTCRIWALSSNRLVLIRFLPYSYFCTCWKVRRMPLAESRPAHAQHHAAHVHTVAHVLVNGECPGRC
jgi:hypothetical protein